MIGFWGLGLGRGPRAAGCWLLAAGCGLPAEGRGLGRAVALWAGFGFRLGPGARAAGLVVRHVVS